MLNLASRRPDPSRSAAVVLVALLVGAVMPAWAMAAPADTDLDRLPDTFETTTTLTSPTKPDTDGDGKATRTRTLTPTA